MPATVGTLKDAVDVNSFFMGTRATPESVMEVIRKSMKDAVT
jgi:hypothetical protein